MSGNDLPFSHFETACLETKSLEANCSCVKLFSLRYFFICSDNFTTYFLTCIFKSWAKYLSIKFFSNAHRSIFILLLIKIKVNANLSTISWHNYLMICAVIIVNEYAFTVMQILFNLQYQFFPIRTISQLLSLIKFLQ